MKWEIAQLTDKTSYIKRGVSPKYVEDNGFVVLNQKCIRDNRIDYTPSRLSDNQKTYPEDKILKKGDILINSTGKGTLGRTAQIKDDLEETQLVDTHITIVRAKDNVDPFFLGQLIRRNEPLIESLGKGSTQQLELSRTDLGEVKLSFPPLATQLKIATILSVYDDLIENNLKRIKLLEEKAQLHYKQIMSELNSAKTIHEEYIKDCLLYYIGGGWGEENYKEGFTEPAYVIRGTDIPDVRGGDISGVPLRFHKPSNLESRKMQIGDIAFEISNGQINNIGRTVLMSQKLLGQFAEPVMCASFAKLIRVNEKVSPEFFYLFLNEGQQNGLLYQYKSNSANGINNFAFETFIDEVKIVVPKENELKYFTEIVKPIFALINTLGEQNSKLREARDILLPRLMSGEIEV